MGWCSDMTYWRKNGPNRKILRANSLNDLTKFIDENTKRHWHLISEIQLENGRFEVLVELKNGANKQREIVKL